MTQSLANLHRFKTGHEIFRIKQSFKTILRYCYGDLGHSLRKKIYLWSIWNPYVKNFFHAWKIKHTSLTYFKRNIHPSFVTLLLIITKLSYYKNPESIITVFTCKDPNASRDIVVEYTHSTLMEKGRKFEHMMFSSTS